MTKRGKSLKQQAAELERAANSLGPSTTVDAIAALPEADRPNAMTVIPAALARGAEGKVSVHSRKSLDDQRSARKPRSEPEVSLARVVKAGKATRKAKPAAKAARGSRLSLKQNVEVRKLLTAAAAAAGGTRLTPIGFDSYSTFLAGVPLDADGNATVVFIPVKGNAPVAGKNVKLTIKGGKVVKVA